MTSLFFVVSSFLLFGQNPIDVHMFLDMSLFEMNVRVHSVVDQTCNLVFANHCNTVAPTDLRSRCISHEYIHPSSMSGTAGNVGPTSQEINTNQAWNPKK